MAATYEQASMDPRAEWQHFPPVDTHLLHSSHVAQTFKIQVMQPLRALTDTTRLPVVYATDGNLTFEMFKGMSYLMQMSRADAPRFILVGIGYPGDCPLAGAVLRGRDLLCEHNPRVNAEPPSIEGVLLPERGTPQLYRAIDFQRFIADELTSFIDERYTTQPDERIYFGHSAGGGFGLYTMFTMPELFRKYVLSSPGLCFDGMSSAGVHYVNHDFLFDEARRFIASGVSLPGVRVHMSVSTEEEFEPPPTAGYRLTSSFHRMAALLRRAAIVGLDLTTEVFTRETHMTVWPLAFLHGIQAVLSSPALRCNEDGPIPR